MKTNAVGLVGVLLLGISTSFAADITISDLSSSSTFFGTADTRYNIREDNETEANTVGSQVWDLEAFVVQGTKLYVIGGFDFKNGVAGYPNFSSGDIFVDSNNNAKWGPNAHRFSNDGYGDGYINYGNNLSLYNYAIHMDFSQIQSKFVVYSLTEDANTTLSTGYYRQNDGSNPWKYVSGGTQVSLANDSLEYYAGLSDASVLSTYGVNLTGGNHYVVGVDMSWYSSTSTSVETHFTMGCGNDELEGKLTGGFDIQVPDGATTALLLGMGLTGLGLIRNRAKA